MNQRYISTSAIRLLSIALVFLFGCVQSTAPATKQLIVEECRPSNLYPFRSKDKLILTTASSQGCKLTAFDVQTLDSLWSYTDEATTNTYYKSQPYINDNSLTFPLADKVLSLNIETGAVISLWPIPRYDNYSMSGKENLVYRSIYNVEASTIEIREYNLTSGSEQIVFSRELANVSYCRVQSPQIVGDYYLVSNFYLEQQTKKTISSILKIDFSGNIVDSLQLHNFDVKLFTAKPPIMQGKTSYWNMNSHILKVNHEPLDIEWMVDMRAKILTSEMFLHNGELYYPAENHLLYKVSTDGVVLDSVSIPGTPSKMFVKDQSICFIGGSDLKLYKGTYLDLKNKEARHDSLSYLSQCYFDDDIEVLLSPKGWLISRQ